MSNGSSFDNNGSLSMDIGTAPRRDLVNAISGTYSLNLPGSGAGKLSVFNGDNTTAFTSNGTYTLLASVGGLSNGLALGNGDTTGAIAGSLSLANFASLPSGATWKFESLTNPAGGFDVVLEIAGSSGVKSNIFFIGGTNGGVAGDFLLSTALNWVGSNASDASGVTKIGDSFDHMLLNSGITTLTVDTNYTTGALIFGNNTGQIDFTINSTGGSVISLQPETAGAANAIDFTGVNRIVTINAPSDPGHHRQR